MPRREDWEIDIDDAIKKEEWRPTGPNRPIKVFPAERPLESDVCGYFTLGKYLLRKTPAEIERDLGFPSDFLKYGARLYKFTRLPQITEYEYELTADHPDGLSDQGSFPRKIYFVTELFCHRVVQRAKSAGFTASLITLIPAWGSYLR